jgi:hypothetical protein
MKKNDSKRLHEGKWKIEALFFFQWLLKMISIGAKKNLSAIEILTGNHKSRL